MLLSEAILAGSTLVKQMPCPLAAEEAAGWGCALTMAAKAMGRNGVYDCFSLWPWLDKAEHFKTGSPAFWAIVSKFDSYVCEGKMTLEQLVDYVRSIEPPETPEIPQADQGDEQPISEEELWGDNETSSELSHNTGTRGLA